MYVVTGRDFLKLLQEEGFIIVNITGSHHELAKERQVVVVPVHGNRELGKGLVHKILKQAGLK